MPHSASGESFQHLCSSLTGLDSLEAVIIATINLVGSNLGPDNSVLTFKISAVTEELRQFVTDDPAQSSLGGEGFME
jgi:hypothetical protein